MESLENLRKKLSETRTGWFKLPASPSPEDEARYAKQRKANNFLCRELYRKDPERRAKAKANARKWIEANKDWHRKLVSLDARIWQAKKKGNFERAAELIQERELAKLAHRKERSEKNS